jgi:hypothetical protein
LIHRKMTSSITDSMDKKTEKYTSSRIIIYNDKIQ